MFEQTECQKAVRISCERRTRRSAIWMKAEMEGVKRREIWWKHNLRKAFHGLQMIVLVVVVVDVYSSLPDMNALQTIIIVLGHL